MCAYGRPLLQSAPPAGGGARLAARHRASVAVVPAGVRHLGRHSRGHPLARPSSVDERSREDSAAPDRLQREGGARGGRGGGFVIRRFGSPDRLLLTAGSGSITRPPDYDFDDHDFKLKYFQTRQIMKKDRMCPTASNVDCRPFCVHASRCDCWCVASKCRLPSVYKASVLKSRVKSAHAQN